MIVWLLLVSALGYGAYRLFTSTEPTSHAVTVTSAPGEGVNVNVRAARGGQGARGMIQPAPKRRDLSDTVAQMAAQMPTTGEPPFSVGVRACAALVDTPGYFQNGPVTALIVNAQRVPEKAKAAQSWPFFQRSTAVIVTFTDLKEPRPLTYWGSALPNGTVAVTARDSTGGVTADELQTLYALLEERRIAGMPLVMFVTEIIR